MNIIVSVPMFSNGLLELTLIGILLHCWFVGTPTLTHPDDKYEWWNMVKAESRGFSTGLTHKSTINNTTKQMLKIHIYFLMAHFVLVFCCCSFK